jgi:hypothetical protein
VHQSVCRHRSVRFARRLSSLSLFSFLSVVRLSLVGCSGGRPVAAGLLLAAWRGERTVQSDPTRAARSEPSDSDSDTTDGLDRMELAPDQATGWTDLSAGGGGRLPQPSFGFLGRTAHHRTARLRRCTNNQTKLSYRH